MKSVLSKLYTAFWVFEAVTVPLVLATITVIFGGTSSIEFNGYKTDGFVAYFLGYLVMSMFLHGVLVSIAIPYFHYFILDKEES